MSLEETDARAPGTVGVVGTGLIGTSIGMALRRHGVDVYLTDRDERRTRTAVARGAGRSWRGRDRVDHIVLAIPPDEVAKELRRLQDEGRAGTFTDTASVKERVYEEAGDLGCDLSTYCGAHPVAGRERSGPEAASPDLFQGRPWVLSPSPVTSPPAGAHATWVALACGAVPVRMGPREHDEVLGLLSHVPQLISSLLAARMAHVPESVLRLAGTGLDDTTRLAASDSSLWTDIVTANAGPIRDVLQAFARDLDDLRLALGQQRGAVQALLSQGNRGKARLVRSKSRALALVPPAAPRPVPQPELSQPSRAVAEVRP